MNHFVLVPCLDSAELAAARRRELDIRRDLAAELGQSAVEIARTGFYFNAGGERVEIGELVTRAVTGKQSLPRDALLPTPQPRSFAETLIQVANETTLGACRRLVEGGHRPLALNFANGAHPGGGFLGGAKAQEEVLCRSSALYRTLVGDPMYDAHRKRLRPDSTDWAIYSPDVPVFRRDDGTELDHPWLLSFITCAAPYVPKIGQPESGDLLQKRIHGGEPYSYEGNSARQISHSGTPRAHFMKRIDLIRHLEKHGASCYARPIRTQTHYAAFRTGG